MLSKTELRLHLRKVRQELSEYRFFWKPELLDACAPQFKPGLTVAGYTALGGEVGVDPLMELALDCGCVTALPYLETRAADMEFRLWTDRDALEIAPFGFAQPAATAVLVEPDILIVPLLGFDAQLNRLGQGAGHYDRYFSNHPNALRIGVGWSQQKVEALPVDPWDVPMDAILTEQGLITAPNSRIPPQ